MLADMADRIVVPSRLIVVLSRHDHGSPGHDHEIA
jgi:hypothetical protein